METSSLVNVQNGRDHNPYAFSLWLAGGGRDFRLTDVHGNVVKPILA